MKVLLFSGRNAKEILRDPVSCLFGLGFPLVLLLLFDVIGAAIPEEANNAMFSIQNTAPGIAAFGTAFFALFSGVLLAKDKTTSFLMRLFASPMKATDFILGYTLPLIIMACVQAAITFGAAGLLGLRLSPGTLLAVLTIIPIAVMFVGLGLLCGSLLSEKAVSGICGALLTNIAGWFSGVWIPLDLIGGVFKQAALVLPFYHAAEAAKAAGSGNYGDVMPHLMVVLVYAAVCYALAVFAFRRKMAGDKG